MKMMNSYNFCIIIFTLLVSHQITIGQDYLSQEEAVRKTLENNFNIAIAKNNTAIAENDLSKNNTGNVPSLSLNAGYIIQLDNTNANFQDGRSTSLIFAPTQRLNAALNLGYVLYDGNYRKKNIAQLESRKSLTELALEASIENAAAITLSQYFQIGMLIENQKQISKAIELSTKRLKRNQELLAYGQANGLSVLNAEVDLNNDSLSYYNIDIQIENAKRLLNNYMVDQSSLDYTVDNAPELDLSISYENLKADMLRKNLAISQIDKNIEIGGQAIDLAETAKMPTIRADVSYGYDFSKNNSASFLSSLNNNGLNASLSFSWNIFDGGRTKYNVEQSRLSNLGLGIQRDQLIKDLELQFDTAWANYQDRKILLKNQEKNVTINRANFERTEEQYKVGQITSVDFRQAQLNLLNAETALNNAGFEVKLAQLELLLISGNIIE